MEEWSPSRHCIIYLNALLGELSEDEIIDLYLHSPDMEVAEFEELLHKATEDQSAP